MKNIIVFVMGGLGAFGGLLLARIVIKVLVKAGATMVTLGDVFGVYILCLLLCIIAGIYLGLLISKKIP
jgi:hypothetical protein